MLDVISLENVWGWLGLYGVFCGKCLSNVWNLYSFMDGFF